MSNMFNGTPGVIVMAAGLGKRMHSKLPKVLQPLAGQPILLHILDRLLETLPGGDVAIVVGHGRESVEAVVRSWSGFSALRISFVVQKELRGTGDAVRSVFESGWGSDFVKKRRSIMVLPGDSPVLSRELIAQLAVPLPRTAVMRLLTTTLEEPTGYGRVMRRGKSGPILRIVEEKDCNPRERLTQEVATSIYLFDSAFLKSSVQRLNNSNAQGEYYLTDVVAQAVRAKKRIENLHWTCADEVMGINTPWELSIAHKILNRRLLKKWSMEGALFCDPDTTWVEVGVTLGSDVRVGPGVLLQGNTRVGRGTTLAAHCVIKNSEIGESVELKPGCVIENSVVLSRSSLGPYAHLRPGASVGEDCKIGNFVELKNSRIGNSTSIAHLSYVGDAEVGTHVNIGCGFVTCNYDGRIIDGQRKHKTTIEDGVFIGSDCQTVAPVKLSRGSYIASGSTITEDVEPGALAIARARQVNKPGYSKKLLERRAPTTLTASHTTGEN